MKKKILALLICIGSIVAVPAFAAKVPGPLVEGSWLVRHLGRVIIVDVREDTRSFGSRPVFAIDKKSGKKVLIKVGGHIPGAVLLDFDHVRTRHMINNRVIDNMLPEKIAFEQLVRKLGIYSDSVIVVVSKGESVSDMAMAARVYWQFKYYGHDNITILNGGTAQWITEGRRIEMRTKRVRPGNWTAGEERVALMATSEDASSAMKDAAIQLVDNRPLAQYLGIYSPPDVAAKGHIPGARLFAPSLMTNSNGSARFLSASELRTLMAAMGIKYNQASIVYCNNGHLASAGWFVLSEILGNRNVRLYDGSMHQWALERRPMTTMRLER